MTLSGQVWGPPYRSLTMRRAMSEHTERLISCGNGSWPRRSSFDVDGKRNQADELERQASDPSLWEDQQRAQQITSKLSRLRDHIGRYDSLIVRLDDAAAIDELLADETDPDLARELASSVEALEADVDKLELAALLSGTYDGSDAIATINAGAGGTESQDWAEMLLRMYTRWAEREGLDVEIDEIQHGEEAGIKSATFTVHGTNVYGLLSAERGVHRLVRISPFDAQKRRHTSFASLEVIPMSSRPTPTTSTSRRRSCASMSIVRVDRAARRSHEDSAVRITHIPTGIVVTCQNERSQLQNRAVVLAILKVARHASVRSARRRWHDSRERKALTSAPRSVRTCSRPYQMVKDHRTDEEMGDPGRVLDGDIDRFIGAELRRRAAASA